MKLNRKIPLNILIQYSLAGTVVLAGFIWWTLLPQTSDVQVVTATRKESANNIEANAPTPKPLYTDILFNGKYTGYVKDETSVYYAPLDSWKGEELYWSQKPVRIPGADPITFVVIVSEPNEVGTLYAKDRAHTYAYDKLLPTKNLDAFETFGRGDAFAIDDTAVYLFGEVLLEINKENVEIYYRRSIEMANNAYYILIHNTKEDEWFGSGYNGNFDLIPQPSLSDLDSKAFPE
ncbi:MAG: hypothetical protein WAZ27_05295 [Minisyncoccia bacterium]